MLTVKQVAERLGITAAKCKQLSLTVFGSVKSEFTEEDVEKIKSEITGVIESVSMLAITGSETPTEIERVLDNSLTGKQEKILSSIALNNTQKYQAKFLLSLVSNFQQTQTAIDKIIVQFQEGALESVANAYESLSEKLDTSTSTVGDMLENHKSNYLVADFAKDLQRLLEDK